LPDSERDLLGLSGTQDKPGWQGKLIADSFSGYKACFELRVTEVGCMAHARCKFDELWANHQSQIAEQALKFFGQIALGPATRIAELLPNHWRPAWLGLQCRHQDGSPGGYVHPFS
jgi:hypothetical protein